MTDLDPITGMTDDELQLRAELRRTLVPPPVPDSLHAAVDALAEDNLAGRVLSRRSWGEVLRVGRRRFGVAVGAVAVLGLTVLGSLVLSSRGDGDVAATPSPTLPAATQPSATLPTATHPALPDPTGTEDSVVDGAWIDANSAWALAFDMEAEPLAPRVVWMTTDGGQTWSQRGPMPSVGSPTFFDAMHGYQTGAVVRSGSGYGFQVNLTTDGGRSWHAVTAGTLSPDSPSVPNSEAHFTDALHGVVLGTSMVANPPEGVFSPPIACGGWATEDGGQTWTVVPTAPCVQAQAHWSSPTLGVQVDVGCATAVTVDGGRHWTTGTLPNASTGGLPCDSPGRTVYEVQLAVEPSAGVVRIGGYFWTGTETGNDPQPDPLVVLESGDGGASWHEAYRSTAIDAYTVRGIKVFGPDHWLATVPDGQDTAIRETSDGGRSWTTAGWMLNFGADTTAWLDRLHGAAPGMVTSVCPDDDVNHCVVRTTTLFTNDGGKTWHDVPF